MTFNRVSTYQAAYENQQRFRQLNFRYSELSQQLTTNLKVQEIVEHGYKLPTVQDLRNRLNQRDRLIDGIGRVQPVVAAYNTSLESLIDSAGDLRGFATIQSADYDSWLAQVRPGVENFLKSFRASLNSRVFGRYIFSGVRFEIPPVALEDTAGNSFDLHQLPNFLINHTPGQNNLRFDTLDPLGSPLYRVDNPALPIYDARHDSTNPAGPDVDAYRSLTQFVDYGNPLPYSVSSNSVPLQRLFHGARLLFSATEIVGQQGYAARTEVINEAFATITEAIDEIRNIRNQNDLNKYILGEAEKSHKASFDSISHFYAKEITVENTNLVAVELSNLDNAIQASFRLLNRRNQLSLVNYLP